MSQLAFDIFRFDTSETKEIAVYGAYNLSDKLHKEIMDRLEELKTNNLQFIDELGNTSVAIKLFDFEGTVGFEFANSHRSTSNIIIFSLMKFHISIPNKIVREFTSNFVTLRATDEASRSYGINNLKLGTLSIVFTGLHIGSIPKFLRLKPVKNLGDILTSYEEYVENVEEIKQVVKDLCSLQTSFSSELANYLAQFKIYPYNDEDYYGDDDDDDEDEDY